jgi:hypothetical protein
VTLYFDESDRQEARALAMSRVLATRHGRRKGVLIAALDALYGVYEATGEIPSATEIANVLASLAGQSQAPAMGFTNAVSRAVQPVHTPAPPRNFEPVTVQISGGAGDAKASALATAQNFIASAGAMGFFD